MTDRDMRRLLDQHDPPPPPNPETDTWIIIACILFLYGYMLVKVVVWLAERQI